MRDRDALPSGSFSAVCSIAPDDSLSPIASVPGGCRLPSVWGHKTGSSELSQALIKLSTQSALHYAREFTAAVWAHRVSADMPRAPSIG